ncbi:uncharacterized protein LOC143459828 [Clavelina lepadiformis]|uniref:Uncharacterized protein n=1 Tax=Clavelina lepadiformis TaxID=159417 RepID=A0ABP0FP48_CLALP
MPRSASIKLKITPNRHYSTQQIVYKRCHESRFQCKSKNIQSRNSAFEISKIKMFVDKCKLVLLCVAIFSLSGRSSALVIPQSELNNLSDFLEPLMESFLGQASIPDMKDNEKLQLTNLDITNANVGSITITNPKPSQFKVSLKDIDLSINGRFRVKQEVKVPIVALPFVLGRKKRFIGKAFKKIKNIIKKPVNVAKKVVKTVIDKSPKFKLTTIKSSGSFKASGKIDLTVTLKLTFQGGKLVLTTLPNSCDDDIDDFKVKIGDNKFKFLINPILSLLRGTIARKYIEDEICEAVEDNINKGPGTTVFSIPPYLSSSYFSSG